MADCERDGCPMEGRIARLEEWQRTSESFHTKIDTWQRDMIASTTRMETQQKAMDGKLAAARDLYEQGEEAFLKGHKVHAGLLTRFAQGEEIAVDILMVHAQCQMMSAEDFKVLAQKLIEHREKQR